VERLEAVGVDFNMVKTKVNSKSSPPFCEASAFPAWIRSTRWDDVENAAIAIWRN